MGKAVNNMRNIMIFLWYRFCGAAFRLCPIQKNKIVFENFFGKGYGENPKYIADELLCESREDLKIIWFTKGTYIFPEGIQPVKRGTLQELYHLATARVWVDNSRKHVGVKKRGGQYYMQTWHGSIAFKCVEMDTELDKWYIASAQNDAKMTDVMLSGSRWQTEQFHKIFWYKGLIMEEGIPKNDYWIKAVENREKIKGKVCKQFTLETKCKLALYAPTFREKNSFESYNIDYPRLIKNLKKYWGGEWKILIRLHPNIEKEDNSINYSDSVINASYYSDINELILAAELLISDYSSCLFDAVYIEKPSVIYASDIIQYERDRGMAIPLEESPAPLAENNMELEQVIKEFNVENYIRRCREFSTKYGVVHNKNASARASAWILDKIK